MIEAEARDLEREVELQRERLALAERAAARQRELRDRAIATEQNLLEAEQDALDQAVALQALERNRTALARTRLELEAERDELPLREAMQLAETDRAIAALDQALAEAEAAREIVITAPEAGTVTGLRAASGSSVGPDAPLMTLVPAGARLEARLYGPSRAIGFVRPGQRVRLRYEAFPHQKFGQYEGVVKSVSRSTVGPAELTGDGAPLPGLVRRRAGLSRHRRARGADRHRLRRGGAAAARHAARGRRADRDAAALPVGARSAAFADREEPGMNAADRLQFGWGRRLPVVLQAEAAECGLACLAMIAGYHGQHSDPTALRRRFGFSLKGATLKDLIGVARPDRPRLAAGAAGARRARHARARPASCTGTSTISWC